MYYFNAILQQQCCESLLSKHPDRDYLDHILTGIKEGFRVGFEDVAPVSNREFTGCVRIFGSGDKPLCLVGPLRSFRSPGSASE